MKKLIVTLILGLITVLSFSSCGNSKKDAENLIVGDWILVGDNMGHHLMDDESAHIFFNADGTWKTVYTLGDVTKTHKGKYYIVNENTIAMARNGEHQQDFHFEIIGENELHLQDNNRSQATCFLKRANN